MTGGPVSLGAVAVDATGTQVVGATLTYCVDAMVVCSVDASGNVYGASPGTAVITICNGGVQKTVTVNVTL